MCKQNTWDWRTLDFAFFVLKWTILKRIWRFHQEKHTPKYSGWDGNLVKVYLWEKGKMANVMFEILDGFSSVWALMYRHSKSRIFKKKKKKKKKKIQNLVLLMKPPMVHFNIWTQNLELVNLWGCNSRTTHSSVLNCWRWQRAQCVNKNTN